MSDSLRDQIYNNMDLKDSEELLSIWLTDNHNVWTDEAFGVIEEILAKRNVTLPPRGSSIPATEEENADENISVEEEDEYHPEDFTPEERIIIEDETPPDFYNPFEVIRLSNRLKFMAKLMLAFIVLSNLTNYSKIYGQVHAYFVNRPIPWLEAYVTISIIVIDIILAGAGFYFLLVALSQILRILMEMEYNSRK